MESSQKKEAGSNTINTRNTRSIRRKPPSLKTLPKKDHTFIVQESYSQCEWCSTPENPVYMGLGFYCPHYHGGTPCLGHPMNLNMKNGGSIFNCKNSDGGDSAQIS